VVDQAIDILVDLRDWVAAAVRCVTVVTVRRREDFVEDCDVVGRVLPWCRTTSAER
jgi:hypothetical protein